MRTKQQNLVIAGFQADASRNAQTLTVKNDGVDTDWVVIKQHFNEGDSIAWTVYPDGTTEAE